MGGETRCNKSYLQYVNDMLCRACSFRGKGFQAVMQDLNKVIAEKDAEISRLRLVLQRIRRWGSPMIKGYIDAALVGRQAGGSDPLVDDQVGEVGEQGAQG
jgi:hypothetical protein